MICECILWVATTRPAAAPALSRSFRATTSDGAAGPSAHTSAAHAARPALTLCLQWRKRAGRALVAAACVSRAAAAARAALSVCFRNLARCMCCCRRWLVVRFQAPMKCCRCLDAHAALYNHISGAAGWPAPSSAARPSASPSRSSCTQARRISSGSSILRSCPTPTFLPHMGHAARQAGRQAAARVSVEWRGRGARACSHLGHAPATAPAGSEWRGTGTRGTA